MKIKRETSIFIKNIIDNWLPPFLRDSKLFFFLPFYLVYKKHYKEFFEFREKAFFMTDEQIREKYKLVQDCDFQINSDLNKKSIELISKNIKGKKVLDVACGEAYLAKMLAKKYKVTGLDFIISKACKNGKNLEFIEGNINNLNFKDKSFDTVISAHTLEHCKDIKKAYGELCRITKKRLLIVLPKEKPYKFGFNFHLHFFPYKFNLFAVFGTEVKCFDADGDWFLIKDFE